ncbi:hypothetical protein ON058_07680 [Demequina sp. B12]|uniref:hypothetical protein n=1 Tax=Demequina sp. B12 TaxID=2992757 RepID=UPI00237AF774|nr:hypothetical protein [Demequina sp. B12]MDE0573292.1 hypothetical protein [Demequina sp. B12]
MTNELADLSLPGARGTTQVQGAQGIFYKVLLNGEPVSRRKGAWPIPAKGGETELRARGLLPGFQTLWWNGTEVYRFGAHASVLEKVVMFAPLLLTLSLTLVGLFLGLVLFFVSVLVVKNVAMPKPLRIALPLVNTVAGGVIVAVLGGLLG